MLRYDQTLLQRAFLPSILTGLVFSTRLSDPKPHYVLPCHLTLWSPRLPT